MLRQMQGVIPSQGAGATVSALSGFAAEELSELSAKGSSGLSAYVISTRVRASTAASVIGEFAL